ncbi:hypothetical protein SNK04_013772 [Fusarium graminearum]
MGLHTATDIARNAQRSFDGLLPAGTEVDSTALESLRALPAVLEDVLGYQGPTFWAKAARLLDSHRDAELAELFRSTRDRIVNEKVEDTAGDESISANGAIDLLLKRYAA